MSRYNNYPLKGRISVYRKELTSKRNIRSGEIILCAVKIYDDFYRYQFKYTKANIDDINIDELIIRNPRSEPIVRLGRKMSIGDKIHKIAHNGRGSDDYKLIKRIFNKVNFWLYKKYRTGIREESIDLYLSEFAFRFSDENRNVGGRAFYNLLDLMISTPIPNPKK
jgi:hypothetical protein